MSVTTARVNRNLWRDEEPEWAVWLLVAVLLAIGLIARTLVVNRSTAFSEGNVSVSYPASWTPHTAEGNALLDVGEPFDTGLFPARFSLLQMPAAEVSRTAQSLGDFALKWSDQEAQDLLGYRVLSIEPMKVRDLDAVRMEYVYVAEPAVATPNSIPVVARGSDVLLRKDDTLTVARFLAGSDEYDGLRGTWDRILGSLELK